MAYRWKRFLEFVDFVAIILVFGLLGSMAFCVSKPKLDAVLQTPAPIRKSALATISGPVIPCNFHISTHDFDGQTLSVVSATDWRGVRTIGTCVVDSNSTCFIPALDVDPNTFLTRNGGLKILDSQGNVLHVELWSNIATSK